MSVMWLFVQNHQKENKSCSPTRELELIDLDRNTIRIGADRHKQVGCRQHLEDLFIDEILDA